MRDHHIKRKAAIFSAARSALAVAVILGLAACTGSRPPSPVPSAQTGADPLAGAHYKVGKPYQIDGTWYYPQEDEAYVETGVASWYGPGFHGKRTANGELYDQTAMTAAHRTLPLPSVVRVTNLQNGRSIVLRVNDRGPFAKNRIIDVSHTAAQQLGFDKAGTAPVRVEILAAESRLAVSQLQEPGVAAPPAVPIAAVEAQSLDAPAAQSGKAAPASGASAPRPQPAVIHREQTAAAVPVGEVRQSVPADSAIFVQAGAFSALYNAERLRARIAGIGPTKISEKRNGSTYLYRVRVGPVASVDEADRIATVLQANNINDVHIVVE